MINSQNKEKDKRAAELIIANKELAFQKDEKSKRAVELAIANKELAFQNEEKDKRAAELIIANKELAFQNEEKDKRAAELIIANKELAFQNEEKSKRAVELAIAKELAFQSEELGELAAELAIVNKELAFQIDEKDKRSVELNVLAFYDTLTGLPNRRLLVDRLNHALTVSVRNKFESAVMFIDLDNFKDINDTLGHRCGDILLQEAAQRLRSCLREGDTVARLGGDEFVLVLEGLGKTPIEAAKNAKCIGDKALAALNKPYLLHMHEYLCTASIGAALSGQDGNTAEDLLRQADISMYQAKQAGRNTMRFFNEKMQDAINVRTTLENELRQAVKKAQFNLHYQVQMDDSRRPIGAEALIRWQHPERGLISPDMFIPLAQETGLIQAIGEWVIETACTQLGEWQKDALTRDLTLAVNVSARQFRQTDFVAQVLAAVQRHPIPPKSLKLELTESLLQEDIEATIAAMKILNDVGVQFSLDDFGTGYSSLQYLKRLPISQFKIDQSFVRDIAIDSSDRTIIQTIISMAHSLNINVIAEGVETEEQLQLLVDNGCTSFQGYLFGKPVPIDQFNLKTAAL